MTAAWRLSIITLLFLGGCAGSDSRPLPTRPDTERSRVVLGGEVIVIVPHPDDEVLGCGGEIYRAVREGLAVTVLIVTNGEADGDGCYFWHNGCPLDSCPGSPCTQEEAEAYGRLRIEESVRALAVLGVPASRVIPLGYPDARLRAMRAQPELVQTGNTPRDRSFTGKTMTGDHLAEDLAAFLGAHEGATVFTTDREDRHPDHAALAFIVEDACRQGRRRGTAHRLYTAIIHAPGADESRWPLPVAEDGFRLGHASEDRRMRYQPDWELTAPPGVTRAPVVSWNEEALWKAAPGRDPLLLQAIEQFRSQIGSVREGGGEPNPGYLDWIDRSGWMLGFVRRNGCFWPVASGRDGEPVNANAGGTWPR